MMSPQSTAEADADQENKKLEQITFRFCSECSNMLYPKEDEESHKLQFTCRTCQYTEEATSTCVFRNVMNNAVGETAGVTQDVGSDPTVSLDPSSPSAGASAASAAAPVPRHNRHHHHDDPALCFRCGIALLACTGCGKWATINEYNHCVVHDPNFASERMLSMVRMAATYRSLDPESQASWDSKFAGPSTFLAHSWTAPDDLTQYLPYEIASNSDADPPEAMGIDQEEDVHMSL